MSAEGAYISIDFGEQSQLFYVARGVDVPDGISIGDRVEMVTAREEGTDRRIILNVYEITGH